MSLVPLNLGVNVAWCVPAIKCQRGDFHLVFFLPVIFFTILRFDSEAQLCPSSLGAGIV